MARHCASSSSPAWTASDLRDDPHRAPDKAERVQRMFGAIAHRYDLNNRLHSLGRDQAWRRQAVALCELRPSDEVLDVACGTGDLTFAFAHSRVRSVTGVDFTPAMLAIAREKCAQRSLNVTPSFVQADAMNLPFSNASFDVVAIAWGIRNVAEPPAALREFARVLRPGGRLCVLEFSEPRNRLLRTVNRLYCGFIMPLTATLISRDQSGAYRYLPRSVSKFPDPQTFAKAICEAGFEQPRLESLTLGVCTVSVARVAARSLEPAGA